MSKTEGAVVRRLSQLRWLTLALVPIALTAHAIPPPPPAPPQLREARMTVTVRLVDADHGRVGKLTQLCKVSGTIPVYADDGSAARANGRAIPGCTMAWKGRRLPVVVRGALAVARGAVTFASASVSVVPPDAVPLCPDVCGPQPLADSSGELSVSGTPGTLKFGLQPNPVSLLNAQPAVWLEADVAIAD